MSYTTFQPLRPANLGDQKGLECPQFDQGQGLQEAECPGCDEPSLFRPEELVWKSIDEFEVTEVICPDCGGKFELTAKCTGSFYNFFGDCYSEDANA